MKKQTLVHAACLLVCAASLPTAQAQSGSPALAADTPEIIVTASRTEQILQTAPVGATIITRAQIESAGVLDANEAIRKIGGVAAKSDLNGGREYTLDLRGFGATADQNVVVLIDGVRISENELTGARLSSIAASNIERIEILRGGSGVMWGDGATAGVINVIRKANAKQGTTLKTALSIESLQTRDAQAALEFGNGNTALTMNLRSFTTNGYRANSTNRQESIAFGAAVQEGALKIKMTAQLDNQDARFPGALNQAEVLADPRQARTANLKDKGNTTNQLVTAGVSYDWGKLSASLDLGFKDRTVDSLFSGFPVKIQAQSEQMSPKFSYKDAVGNAAVTTHVGFDFQRWKQQSSWQKGKQNNNAWFASTDWLLPTGTRIVLGGRREAVLKNADNGSVIDLHHKLTATEVALNQTVMKGVDVYGRMARSFRTANIDEYTFTNPLVALRPQTSSDKELGLKWRDNHKQAAVRYFSQETIDELGYDPAANGPFGPGANINLDPTKRSGFEIQGSVVMSPAVTFAATMQSMKAIFSSGLNAGKHIPLVSEQTATLRVNYRIAANQSVDVAWRLLGGAYFGGDVTNTCTQKIPSNRQLDAYYRWQDKSYEVAIGASNLTNARSYTYAVNCGAFNEGLYPEAGRALKASLKYNF